MNDGDGRGEKRSRRWVGRRTIAIVTPEIAVVVVGLVIGGVVPTCVLSASTRVGIRHVIVTFIIVRCFSTSGVQVGLLVSCVGHLAFAGLVPGVAMVALVLIAVARLLWGVAIQSYFSVMYI